MQAFQVVLVVKKKKRTTHLSMKETLETEEFDPWVGKILWRRKIATHSSILAWEIPWIVEPGRLQSSMGSQRVRWD